MASRRSTRTHVATVRPHAYVMDARIVSQFSDAANTMDVASPFFARTLPDWCVGHVVGDEELEDVFGGPHAPGYIEEQLDPTDPVATALWIMAHGDSGHMQLCHSGLGLGNVHRMAHVSTWLRGPCFLVSCNVASAVHERTPSLGPCQDMHGSLSSGLISGDAAVRGGTGYRFMRALADTIRHPVVAPLDMQHLDLQTGGWRLTGTTMRVDPGGGYEIWQGVLLNPGPDGQCHQVHVNHTIAPSEVPMLTNDPYFDMGRM